eukprot:2937730-Rhodomonas_salina.2
MIQVIFRGPRRLSHVPGPVTPPDTVSRRFEASSRLEGQGCLQCQCQPAAQCSRDNARQALAKGAA